jgi:hypothetical protein
MFRWTAGEGIIVLVLAVCTGGARAAILPYTQLTENRDISVRAVVSGPGGDVVRTDGESSNAPGTFFRSISYNLTGQSPGPGTPPHAAIAVDQGMVFGETSIFGGSGLDLRISGEPTAGANGGSRTDTTFNVQQPTPFVLNGNLHLAADAPRALGSYAIVFNFTGTGPAGETDQFVSISRSIPGTSGFGGTIDEPITAAGTLQPGWTYRLNTLLIGDASVSRFYEFPQFIDGSIDFALTVPEPAGTSLLLGAGGARLLKRRRRVAA